MRIGFVCEYPTLSGGERAMVDLMGHLQARGFWCICLGPAGGALEREVARRALRFELSMARTVGLAGASGGFPTIAHVRDIRRIRLIRDFPPCPVQRRC